MTITAAGSERRVAVGLDDAEDPDGHRATRHDVIAQTTTAFLLETLVGDTRTGAVLDQTTDLPATTIRTEGRDDD